MEIPPVKPDVHVQAHTVRLAKKTLQLTIHESDYSYNLYVGGRDVFCVQAQVFKPGSVYERFMDITIGNLPHLQYSKDCTLDANFQRGVDTVGIVRFIVSYIAENYPHVRQLSFTDASYRTCEDGSVVSLAELSYLTGGATWYTKQFGATLDPTEQGAFAAAHARFQELKQITPWAVLVADYFGECDAEDLFVASDTWQEFFAGLRNKMGAAEFCQFAAPWLRVFMDRFMPFPFSRVKWFMPVQRFASYNLQEGGLRRRHTRRRRRQLRDEP
jgi:hypothetical protein